MRRRVRGGRCPADRRPAADERREGRRDRHGVRDEDREAAGGCRVAGAGAARDEPAAESPAHEPPTDDLPDPEVEEVEVTDLLMVVDLKDEVLVVDEHPRYHVAGCRWVGKRETIPLPIDEARADGFTPCAVCSPDRTLAERARARKHTGS